jgi:large subunit ribosomal protein L21
MLAVIKTGGKQYVVKEGDVLSVEKLGVGTIGTVLFDQVLLIDDGGATTIGTPVVPNAVVKAVLLETYRDDKVLVFKKKRRKQYRRTRGHRQTLAKVKIEKIYPDRTVVPAEELALTAALVAAPAAKPEPKPKTRAKRAAAPKPKPEAVKPAPLKEAKASKSAKPKVEKPKAAAVEAKAKAKTKKAAK